jgi:anti-anti-sigma factor
LRDKTSAVAFIRITSPRTDDAGPGAVKQRLRMDHDKVADVHVGARLTASTCHELRSTVRAAVGGHDAVRLWLDRVERVDAPGLGLLVGLHRLARQFDATLVCINPSPRLTAALRPRGLERVLRLQFILVEQDRRLAERSA